MDSDASYSQNNSGLLRFRSAPGSFFTNFTDELQKSDVNSIIETQGLSSRFSSSDDSKVVINGYVMNSQLPPQYPMQSSAMDGGYRAVSSMAMDNYQGQAKMGSGLMRQNSSPAGLFSHLTSQNDYATMRGPGNYRMGNNSSADLSLASSSLKSQMNNYSSGLSMLSQISEVENENNGTDDEKLENENDETQFYSSEYPFASWNNSSNFGENFTSLKRESIELRNRPPILSHHLSLPKSSAEMAAMEKLLHFQDTIPCKIRAKRGCATHPRSIAERVRRTKISERMRKLQELVPNMDKQTNTADMLDLAVEYIKDLQKQYKTLTDIRANCNCSASKKHVSK